MLCTHCGAQVGVTDEYCARCGSPLRGGSAPRAEGPADESELLAAAIGKNTDYYLPRFESFAGGTATSWNWPSLFVPLPWFLYRKMWVHAIVYFFGVPLVVGVSMAVLAAAITFGGTTPLKNSAAPGSGPEAFCSTLPSAA